MEKKNTAMVLTMLLASVVIFGGCAATPDREEALGVLFQHPTERARDAAMDALAVLGFDVKKTEPLYVEGSRPRKMGLFIGSGGETVGIWLEPMGPDTTKVYVDTAKSFVGYEGQKSWNDQILAEIDKVLKEG